MHPVLLRFWVFEITSYSVMLVLSFAAGWWMAVRRARQYGIDPRLITRLSAWILLAALVGAKLGYAVVHYRDFARSLLDLYHDGVLELSGLVMHGGVLLALAAIWGFTAYHRLSFLRTLDIVAPSFALGIFLTRWGCFLNGCCFGRPTRLPWGVVFPGGSVPLHPVQIYEALFGAAILGALLLFERACRPAEGGTAFLALALYGAARFAAGFFRYNGDDVGIYLGLSHNQYAAAVFLLAGAAGLAFGRGRSRAAGRLSVTAT